MARRALPPLAPLASVLAPPLLKAAVAAAAGGAAEGREAPVARCPGFEAEAPDVDLAGALLGHPRLVASPAACCALCDGEAGCQGFSYLDQYCYLKANFSGTFAKQGVRSLLRSDLGAGCPGFSPAQQGRDLAGDMLEQWYAPTPEACCAACSGKAECQGFAFSDLRCYLKGNVQGTYDNPGVMVRLKEGVLTQDASTSAMPAKPTTPMPPQCPSFNAALADTDIDGQLLSAREADDTDGCCAFCDELAGCEAFAYLGRMCYLKGGFVGTFPKAGVISRVRQGLKPAGPSCPKFEATLTDTDVDGELLLSKEAHTVDGCCSHCDEVEGCEAFAFLGKMCYLKGGFVGTFPKAGVTSRVRQGLKPAPPQCPDFSVPLLDTDVAGELLMTMEVPSIDACCSHCDELSGCEAFAHLGSRCYLQGSFAGTFSKAGVTSRIHRSLGSGCPSFEAVQEDQDLDGELLEQFAAPVPEVCCAACAKKEDCQGVAFAEGQCYLKGRVLGTYPHQGVKTRVKIGVLRAPSPPPPALPKCSGLEPIAADTDLAGKLLATWPGADPDACCPMCDSVQGCEGFVFADGLCLLKGRFSGTFRRAGVVSRLRSSLGAGCPGFASGVGEADQDLAGRLLESWDAPRPEVCCAACAQRPSCEGFAFNAERCYLKGSIEGTYANEGCVANVKSGVLNAGGGRRLGGAPSFLPSFLV